MGFKFPIPPGYRENPVWTGNGFRIGSENVPVLHYTVCDAGWTSYLTEFHEAEADQGNHYIDRASRLHACNELEKNLSADRVVLEIGSSSGYLLRDIKKAFPGVFIIGSDCIPEPLGKIAKHHPDIPLIQFDLVNCPLPDNCVDVIVALNVLEHIEDDSAALRQIHRILKPGGHAIIEVPANPDLYDFYDEQLKHFRRYALDELSQTAKNAGFAVQCASHLGFFVYPAFRFMKLRNKQKMKQTEVETQNSVKHLIQLGGPVMNEVLYFLMKMELNLGRVIRYSRGIRCLITLKKEK
ncbi:methyltransferase domain-containing protein [Methanoregula sp.]|jgi:SAM-dependent methyltransferase|uniref:class I SAM-dependent methyltransferase n=1 Tax=Methanoregula sp. TaxID=2052170 RepID=UPI0035631625